MPHIGGSFAPPITEDHVKNWPTLIAATNGLTRTALEVLHKLMLAHRPHKAKALKGEPHPSGKGIIMPLADDVKKACEPHLPSHAEMEIFGQLFESLGGPIRDVAFHLLWYARELELGREPPTTDLI